MQDGLELLRKKLEGDKSGVTLIYMTLYISCNAINYDKSHNTQDMLTIVCARFGHSFLVVNCARFNPFALEGEVWHLFM